MTAVNDQDLTEHLFTLALPYNPKGKINNKGRVRQIQQLLLKVYMANILQKCRGNFTIISMK